VITREPTIGELNVGEELTIGEPTAEEPIAGVQVLFRYPKGAMRDNGQVL